MQPSSPQFRGLLAVVAWLVCAAVLLALAVWYGPQWLVSHDADAVKLKALNDARGTLLTGLTASLAMVGVAFTLRTVRISQRSFALQVRGQVTQRYNDALEHLGSESKTVRVGAIVALGAVMSDSPDDQPFIVEVLAAFVRERSPWRGTGDDATPIQGICISLRDARRNVRRVFFDERYASVHLAVPDEPDLDVQAAIRVLGAHKPHVRERPIDLSRTDLRRARFVGDFTGTDFRGAHLELSDLHGNFSGADFRYSHLDGADLLSANFTDAYFSHASAVGTMFDNAVLGGCQFRFVDARHATFLSAHVDHNSQFSESDFRHADWDGVQTIRRSIFRSDLDEPTSWSGAKFTHAGVPTYDTQNAVLSDPTEPCGPACPAIAGVAHTIANPEEDGVK